MSDQAFQAANHQSSAEPRDKSAAAEAPATTRQRSPLAAHVLINALLLNTEESYRGAGVSNYSQNLWQPWAVRSSKIPPA